MQSSCRNNKVISLLITGISALILSCNPGKKVLHKAYAFYAEKQQGNVLTDENGNLLPPHPDTLYTVYLEAGSRLLRFDSAWDGSNRYAVSAVLIAGKKVEVGLEKGSLTNPLVLSAGKAGFLYELQLTAVTAAVPPKLLPVGKFLLRFFKGGKTFFYETESLQQIDGVPAY